MSNAQSPKGFRWKENWPWVAVWCLLLIALIGMAVGASQMVGDAGPVDSGAIESLEPGVTETVDSEPVETASESVAPTEDPRVTIVREIVDRAAELDPFFRESQTAYASNAETLGINSLERFVGYWGVVLDDGIVVLNETVGDFAYEGDLPVMAQRRPKNHDAYIVGELELPQEWCNQTITIVPHPTQTSQHYVGLAVKLGTTEGGATAYNTELWIWDESEYVRVDPVQDYAQV